MKMAMEPTQRRPRRLTAVVLSTTFVVLAGCGASDPDSGGVSGQPTNPAPSNETPEVDVDTSAVDFSTEEVQTVPVTDMDEPEVTAPTGALVVDRRPPTDAEYDRLDDDGEGGLIDCEAGGAGTWDWGPIGPDDPTGRESADALLDAIEEDQFLPESGWTELIFSEGSSTFVHSIVNDDWRAIVIVGGDPEAGVWRQLEFFACGPETGGGDPATWSLQPQVETMPTTVLTSDSEVFTVYVTRLGCSGGETGTVLDPQITRSESEIAITFDVEDIGDGEHTCPGNNAVPVEVDLREPVGDRILLDGACAPGRPAASTAVCSDSAVRWAPLPTPTSVESSPPITDEEEIGLVRLAADAGEGTDGAGLTGELVLEHGCISVRDPNEAASIPIIWPARTAWDPTQQAVILDTRAFRLGEIVTLGGSSVETQRFSGPLAIDRLELLTDCIQSSGATPFLTG